MRPFLKWAGGKFRQVDQITNLFPKKVNRLVEPFIGAGAISLNTNYPSYLVNDVNYDVMSLYWILQHSLNNLIAATEPLFVPENNAEDKYYELRDLFNSGIEGLQRTALFLYLNRHCFNGLCRYNSKGGFNVPFGKFSKPYFPKEELTQATEKVKNFWCMCTDFRLIFDMVQEGDVVYCDPPYYPISKSASFVGYVGDFTLKDQTDLAVCAREAVGKGAVVVISNSYTETTMELYKDAQINLFEVSRTISAKTDERKPVKEICAVFK